MLEIGKELARRGLEVTFLPVDRNGELSIDAYVKALRRDTLMVSVMMANNETGVCYPVADLARLAKQTDPQILVHTDATQAVGKLPVDLQSDLRRGRPARLLRAQAPRARRGSAPCSCGAAPAGAPSSSAATRSGAGGPAPRTSPTSSAWPGPASWPWPRMDEEQTRVRGMRDRLQAALLERIPALEVNGKDAAVRLPNTLNLAIHGIEGEAILYELSSQGICASSGSACTSGTLDPSHVLKAMAVPFSAIHGSLRISLSRYNTDAEIDRIIEVLPEIVVRLRRLSPYWDDARNCLKL